MREAIFEAFHQDNRAASTGGVGVGLGLAVVTMFAARLQCKVTLLSEVGRGSVFRLQFPPASPECAVRAIASHPSAEPSVSHQED